MSIERVPNDVTLGELARSMERIERKLDKSIDEHDNDTNTLERRVAALEQWRWFVVGAGAVGGASGLWSIFGGG